VYSWIVVHVPLHESFESEVPYTILAVDLDEGVRLLGRLKDDGTEVAAGARLSACFYEVRGRKLLAFELDGSHGE
jgi:uncharacterized OB-fold protein